MTKRQNPGAVSESDSLYALLKGSVADKLILIVIPWKLNGAF